MKNPWCEEVFDLDTLQLGTSTLLVACTDPLYAESLIHTLVGLGRTKSAMVYPALLPGFAMGIYGLGAPNYVTAFNQTMHTVRPQAVILITHVAANNKAGCPADGINDIENVRRTLCGRQRVATGFRIPVTALVLVPTGTDDGYTLHEVIDDGNIL